MHLSPVQQDAQSFNLIHSEILEIDSSTFQIFKQRSKITLAFCNPLFLLCGHIAVDDIEMSALFCRWITEHESKVVFLDFLKLQREPLHLRPNSYDAHPGFAPCHGGE